MTATALPESDGTRHEFDGEEPYSAAMPEPEAAHEEFAPEAPPELAHELAPETAPETAGDPIDAEAFDEVEAIEAEEEFDPQAGADYADLTALSRARPARVVEEALPELELLIEQAELPSGTSLRHRFAEAEAEEAEEEDEPRGFLGRLFRR